MELLRAKATRTRVSEVIYIGLNALLPVAVLALVRLFDPPYLAVVLVLLSKWRIFALRPRFWWANIKANLVDVLVGLSAVGLLYLASGALWLQIIIAVLYGVWLLVLKPKSGAHAIMLQAGIAQFVSLTVLFHFYRLPEVSVLIGCWLIGYMCARHVISNYEESYVELLPGLWGLFVTELGWLCYRWTNVYNIGLPILLPQIALIMLVIGFCAARMYHASKHQTMTSQMLRGTILFGVALLAVILLFSPWDARI
ncbi:MAG TPA: hypothetical protein VLG40_01135 [Candidatus Saccharimonas sp.]|nr:hypothetical protein [Candidatus Saccharimonas sp.]